MRRSPRSSGYRSRTRRTRRNPWPPPDLERDSSLSTHAFGPQRRAAELARVVAQRLGRELERAGDLVTDQAFAQVGAQLVEVDRRTVVGLHDGMNQVAE